MIIECEGFQSLIKLVHRALHGKNTRTDKRDVDRIKSSVVSSPGSHRRVRFPPFSPFFRLDPLPYARARRCLCDITPARYLDGGVRRLLLEHGRTPATADVARCLDPHLRARG